VKSATDESTTQSNGGLRVGDTVRIPLEGGDWSDRKRGLVVNITQVIDVAYFATHDNLDWGDLDWGDLDDNLYPLELVRRA